MKCYICGCNKGIHNSRSPRGERGLKFPVPPPGEASRESLPPRGAWIEIRVYRADGTRNSSLPPRGAWIEICPSGHSSRA